MNENKVSICFWELPVFFLKTFIWWMGQMDGWMGGRDIFCPFNFLYIQVYNQTRCTYSKYGIKSEKNLFDGFKKFI